MGSFGAVLLVPLLVWQVCGGLAGPATKKAKNVAGPTIEWRTCYGLRGSVASPGTCRGLLGYLLQAQRVCSLPGPP